MCKMILLGWTGYTAYILFPLDSRCVLCGDRCFSPRIRNAIYKTMSLKSQCFLGISAKCKIPSILKQNMTDTVLAAFGAQSHNLRFF